MKAMRVLVTALALVLGASAAVAQTGKTLREQLVGTWDFVVAEITTADGKKNFPFGERPKGMLIFTADGHFSQVHVSGDLPRIASNNRLSGTDADNRAIVHGTLAQFGTYTVDEGKKTLTYHITASTALVTSCWVSMIIASLVPRTGSRGRNIVVDRTHGDQGWHG